MKKITSVFLFLLIIILPAAAQWTQKANTLGSPRYDFAGFSLNAKGYIGGGRFGGPFNSIDTWMKYDPVSNTWSFIATMPYRFTSLSAFAIGNFGYVANGVNDATYNYDTYVYNDVGNNWSTGASMIYPRLRAASATAGTKGYIIGGYGFSAEPLNDFWEYNSISNQWTEKDTLPLMAARYYATAFSAAGNIYLFGGTNDLDYLNDLWKYDTTLASWTQVSAMPAAGRAECISFVINDEAYIVGGTTWTGNVKEVWKYIPATDTWMQLQDFPGINAPVGDVGFTINNKGYIVVANGTNECWEFDPTLSGLETNLDNPLQFSISPNPAHNTFNVECKIWNAELKIYDVMGRDVYQTILNSKLQTLNPNLSSGIYLVRVNEGEKVYQQKVVIE